VKDKLKVGEYVRVSMYEHDDPNEIWVKLLGIPKASMVAAAPIEYLDGRKAVRTLHEFRRGGYQGTWRVPR
jgi:hypothetical protein